VEDGRGDIAGFFMATACRSKRESMSFISLTGSTERIFTACSSRRTALGEPVFSIMISPFKKRFGKRLGDETFSDNDTEGIPGPEAGGLRSDFLSRYESFVPCNSTMCLPIFWLLTLRCPIVRQLSGRIGNIRFTRELTHRTTLRHRLTGKICSFAQLHLT